MVNPMKLARILKNKTVLTQNIRYDITIKINMNYKSLVAGI